MQPILKWAGGKRWLFSREFIAALPSHRRYVEPFLGGAAGFFAVKPKKALISDVNGDLISLYEVVRDDPIALSRGLAEYQRHHSRDFYYSTRSNKPLDKIEAAAWLLYLNRTCWNGLYRLNTKGQFNVPIGTKTAVMLPSDDFVAMSCLLGKAKLFACDFEETINKTGEGDLVFVDPPYTVAHNMNGFVKYNENIFKWEDQARLRDALARASMRGAAIILTNADHEDIRKLYKGFGMHEVVSRRSVISGKVSGRLNVTELMVMA